MITPVFSMEGSKALLRSYVKNTGLSFKNQNTIGVEQAALNATMKMFVVPPRG